jgi:hypothetical protein
VFHYHFASTRLLITAKSNHGEPMNICFSSDFSVPFHWRGQGSSFTRELVSLLRMSVKAEGKMHDPKRLVIYWHEKGYSTKKIHGKLLAHLFWACSTSWTITNWIRALSRGQDIEVHASGGGRFPGQTVDTLIAEALFTRFAH